ncbi:hypothetical protein QJQ45_026937 [Haematococcus lacustris]|nr:hypothetical protein QJQ45_026937 [Haematococcus lacustris]
MCNDMPGSLLPKSGIPTPSRRLLLLTVDPERFLGAGNFSQGGYKAGAVRAGFRKVMEQPSRPSTDPRPDRLVIVDEFRTSRVSSSVHARQPCELHLPDDRPRPADWVPLAGQVNHRLLRPAWSQRHAKCVRGLKWCHEVPPTPPPPPPAPLAQEPPAQDPPAPAQDPPAPAQDPPPPPPAQDQPPAQPPPGPVPPPQAPPWGRWLDRDTNPCLNFQRIGESMQWPLELCSWTDLKALPPVGKEYQQRYKLVNDRLPKAPMDDACVAPQQAQPGHQRDALTVRNTPGSTCSMLPVLRKPYPYSAEDDNGCVDACATPATIAAITNLALAPGCACSMVIGPNGAWWSSDEHVGEDMVSLPASILRATPGVYTIQVTGYQTYSTYELRVQSPNNMSQLVAEEVSLLSSIFEQCCDTSDTMSNACLTLQAAVQDNRTVEQDICSRPPNVCAESGHLVKLVLAGDASGNLVCRGAPGSGSAAITFPQEFGRFSLLESLDLSFNILLGNLSSVAAALAFPNVPNLKRLYLMRNNLGGPFVCNILTPKLEVLWLAKNVLSGPLPACALTHPTLQQLSLSGNLLSGSLPDVIPRTSPLVLLDVGGNGRPDGPSVNATGIQGRLPPSLRNASGLLYLDVSSNSFSGPIPELPTSMEALLASDNKLSGTLPASLAASDQLRMLMAARNRLTGRVPFRLSGAGALMSLDLSNNSLSGPINFIWSSPVLRQLNLSSNNLTGDFPASLGSLDSLRVLDLSDNRLSGSLDAFATKIAPAANSLQVLNVSGNLLTGGLAPSLQGLSLFNHLQPGVVIPAYSSTPSTSVGVEWEPLIPSLTPCFDVANNRLADAWPAWLMPTLARSLIATQNTSNLQVIASIGSIGLRLLGGANLLYCPSPLQPTPASPPDYATLTEQIFAIACVNVTTNATQLVSSALMGSAPALPPPLPAVMPSPPSLVGSSIQGSKTPADSLAVPIAAQTPAKKTSIIAVAAGAAAGGLALGALLALLVWVRRRRPAARRHAAHQASRKVPLTFNTTFDPSSGRDSHDHDDDDEGGVDIAGTDYSGGGLPGKGQAGYVSGAARRGTATGPAAHKGGDGVVDLADIQVARETLNSTTSSTHSRQSLLGRSRGLATPMGSSGTGDASDGKRHGRARLGPDMHVATTKTGNTRRAKSPADSLDAFLSEPDPNRGTSAATGPQPEQLQLVDEAAATASIRPMQPAPATLPVSSVQSTPSHVGSKQGRRSKNSKALHQYSNPMFD